MKQVHAFADQFQTVFAGEGCQIERVVEVGYGCERGAPQGFAQVLVELRLGLLRVVMQDGQPLGIGCDLQTQCPFGGQHGFAQSACQDGSDIVALSRPLAPRDAEQIVLRPERHSVYGHHRLGCIGRIVIIDLARAQHHHRLHVQIGKHLGQQRPQILFSMPQTEVVGDVFLAFDALKGERQIEHMIPRKQLRLPLRFSSARFIRIVHRMIWRKRSRRLSMMFSGICAVSLLKQMA